MIDLSEFRRLNSERTPGKWAYRIDGPSGECVSVNLDNRYPGEKLAEMANTGFYSKINNASFIAYLGTHADEILAELEAGRKVAEVSAEFQEAMEAQDMGLKIPSSFPNPPLPGSYADLNKKLYAASRAYRAIVEKGKE